MIFIKIFSVYLLFALAVLFPGLKLTSKLPWNPSEKFMASISFSLIIIYFLSLLSTTLKVKQAGIIYICLILVSFLVSYKSIYKFVKIPQIKEMLKVYIFINIWLFLFNALIISYSGGEWVMDWYTHLSKSVYYFYSLSPEKLPSLTDRPPLMNLATSFFWAVIGKNFMVYQLLFTLLNSLCILPMILIARRLTSKKVIIPIIFFMCFNPMFIQNATYACTKQLTVFFVLLSLYFYYVGWQDNSKSRFIFSWLLMSCGMLTHYSAAPYAILLILHYAFYSFWRRPAKWQELFISFSASFTLFITWVIWACFNFGYEKTFFSNPSFSPSPSKTMLNYIFAPIENFYYTTFPLFISGADHSILKQTTTLGYLRDCIFLLYQTNFYFCFGLACLPFIIYLLCKNKAFNYLKKPEYFFWFYMIILSFLIAMIVHGDVNPFGIMHISSQTLVFLGLLYLSSFCDRLPKKLFYILAGFVFLDFLAGIMFHMYFQTLPHSRAKDFIWTVQTNWELKLMNKLRFTGDYFIGYHYFIGLVIFSLAIIVLYKFISCNNRTAN